MFSPWRGQGTQCTGYPSGVTALGGKSMSDFFTNVLLHHSERRLGFSLCQHMVVGSTRLTFTQPLSLGFEQGVSGTKNWQKLTLSQKT